MLAQYGKLKREELEGKAKEVQGTHEDEEEAVVDVTIPVQYRSVKRGGLDKSYCITTNYGHNVLSVCVCCRVEDSKLVLEEGSKASLYGFYDPCPGEDKQLCVQYLFKDKMHKVTINDNEELVIPLRGKNATLNHFLFFVFCFYT